MRVFMRWILVVIHLLFPFESKAHDEPLATGGILDLRHTDLRKKSVSLRGEWRFFPNVLLKGSEIEKHGMEAFPSYFIRAEESWTVHPLMNQVNYGTYYLKVLLPEIGSSAGYVLGLQENIGINSAFEIESPGSHRLLARSGQVSDRKHSEIHWWLRKIFPIPDYHPKFLEILVRVSSFSYPYKGLLVPPRIGEWNRLSKEAYLSEVASIASLSILLSLAIYHLILFLLRHEDPANLVFALSCLSMVFRVITTDRLVESIYPEGIRFYSEINYRVLYSAMIVYPIFLFKYLAYIIDRFSAMFGKFVKPVFHGSCLLAALPFVLPDYLTLHRLVYVYEGYTVLSGLLALCLLAYHSFFH